jgi:hypothetical protein
VLCCFLLIYLLELAFADSYLLLSLISLWCSRENWRVLEAAAAKYERFIDGCGGLAGIQLETCAERSSTNSTRAHPHVCRVLAEEEGGDTRRQPQKTP